jgi:hypothetical protein
LIEFKEVRTLWQTAKDKINNFLEPKKNKFVNDEEIK